MMAAEERETGARRRVLTNEATPLLPTTVATTPPAVPSRGDDPADEDPESDMDDDRRLRGATPEAMVSLWMQGVRSNGALTVHFVVLFVLYLFLEHAMSVAFVLASGYLVIKAEKELQKQLALRRGQNVATVTTVAVGSLAALVMMYCIEDLRPSLYGQLWLHLTDRGIKDLPERSISLVFWSVYCNDVYARVLCILFKAVFMIAWAWYRQGPQATIRKICQLVPCSCRSSLFMEVSLASRTRDIEEGLDIRLPSSTPSFDEDDETPTSRRLHFKLRTILLVGEAACLLARVILPTPVWVAFYKSSAAGDIIAGLYASAKGAALLMAFRVSVAAGRQACRDFGAGLEYGRYATAADFGSSGPGNVILASGRGGRVPQAVENGDQDARDVSRECSICYQEYTRPVVLPCGHMFCEGCIAEWLHDHRTCPFCRTEVPPNNKNCLDSRVLQDFRKSQSLLVPQLW